jgi:hypothetical protein
MECHEETTARSRLFSPRARQLTSCANRRAQQTGVGSRASTCAHSSPFDQYIQLTAVGEVIFRASRRQTQRPDRQEDSGLQFTTDLRTAGPRPLPVAVTSTAEGREPNAEVAHGEAVQVPGAAARDLLGLGSEKPGELPLEAQPRVLLDDALADCIGYLVAA